MQPHDITPARACSFPGCEKRHKAQGYCDTHYARIKRIGTIDLPRVPSTEQRFWEKVDKSGECWLWTASFAHNYGQFAISPTKHVLAHRFAWELTNGPIPNGLEVGHNCPGGDDPRCVRPSHMVLLTDAEHGLDRAIKKQTRIGEQNYHAKLNDVAIREIRMRHDAGISKKQLAHDFNVTPDNIGYIVRRKTWKHV